MIKALIKNKNMKTKKLSAAKSKIYARIPFFVAAIVMLVIAGLPNITKTGAQSVQEQISALQAQNTQFQGQVSQLQDQATSYQDAIKKLQAQILAVQGQINANSAEQARLTNEITAAETELAKQKAILGQNIRQMYLDGQISTLEMLASSKDLSEYIDKQQYRNAVQSKITTTMDKITVLRHELAAKKEGVDKLLNQQTAQRAELDSSRSQQSNLLSYNENQQSDFNQKTKDNQSKIAALIASQRKANLSTDGGYYFLRFPGNINGFSPDAYPYRNAGFGMSPGSGCVDNDGPDAWGYCTRQCVSYTAWAVQASGRSAPNYYGNAKDWVAQANSRSVPIYRTPLPGDIAISTSGYWGHSMYVESVSGNTFTTSEYNTYLDGRLTYQTRRF
jgi:peptidoglycan hydrolase CwlO-like protein